LLLWISSSINVVITNIIQLQCRPKIYEWADIIFLF
jgi:hypothetical protein